MHLPGSDVSSLEELLVLVMLLHVVLEGLVFLMLGYQFFKIVLLAERQPFHQTDKELALEEPLLRSA